MRNNNKGRRNEVRRLKYRKRVSVHAAMIDSYINRHGVVIANPKTVDIIKDNGMLCYKTASTPCSCGMCSYKKYKRTVKHKKLELE